MFPALCCKSQRASEFDSLRPQMNMYTKTSQEMDSTTQKRTKRFNIEGQLLKYTNVMKGWQTRWFVLDPESGILDYFEKEELKMQRPRGRVHVTNATVISISDEDSQTFTVVAQTGETFKLRAANTAERQQWVDRLRSAAESHTTQVIQYPAVFTRACCGNGPPEQMERYREDSGPESTSTDKTRQGLKSCEEQCQSSQLHDYIAEACHFSRQMNQKIATLPYSGNQCLMTPVDKDLLLLKATCGATINSLKQCMVMLQMSRVSCSRCAPDPQPDSTVPDSLTSNTASDQQWGRLTQHGDEEEDKILYQDTDYSMDEENRQVIVQILGSLKLGTDLTKVTLPAFVLERRSLLESFADLMGHADLFLSIPDKDSPEQRFLAVLQWYLTSFHAARHGAVAKKPYNSVLGETFHCCWLVPEGEGSQSGGRPPGSIQTDCPQNTLRLVYCAEQVSHHPPQSAFYVECLEKKMCMNGSILFKSKFMGMSIGVAMEGKLVLRLLDHDEEYTCGLPSVYARSILTVPWIELDGKLSLTCQKTHLTASITFHTKPFYGGKVHRVSAEVKNAQSGSSICRVSGEWNSLLEFTQASGEVTEIDTGQLKIWRKLVRPIAKQGEMESRQVWQHVTSALKVKDFDTASEHKQLLEERYREREKHLKQDGAQYFQREGDMWMFKKMLSTSATATHGSV